MSPTLYTPRLRPFALTLMAALGLAACSTTTVPTVPPAFSGAPLPIAGYDWHLNGDPDEISLSYGMAETDDVPLDLSCQAGGQALTLLLNIEKGQPQRIQLESGGETETYRATAELSPLSDSVDLTALAPMSDPVFKRFRQVGWLAVHMGDERRPLVATTAARPQVEKFFELCEQSQ